MRPTPQLRRPQIQEFLQHKLGDPEAAARRFKLLDEVRDLLGLSHNPRMLSFIADLEEDKLREAQRRLDTINSAELYRLILDRWFQFELRRPEPRGVPPALSEPLCREIVAELALRLWSRLERTVGLEEVTEVVRAVVQRHPERKVDEAQGTHQIGSGSLLVRDEVGNFGFVHQSVMEWLVAQMAAAQLVQGQPDPILGRRDMSELMADFFCGLAGRSAAVAWARGVVRSDTAGKALEDNGLLVLKRLGEAIAEPLQLAGHDLRGQDFSGRDLTGANLEGADLTEARLVGANLTRANLSRAILVDADLTEARLTDARLHSVNATRARLLNADLRGAGCADANWRRARLIGATIDGPLTLENSWGAALPIIVPDPFIGCFASNCFAVAISSDGELLASGHADRSVCLWELASGKELRRYTGHENSVRSVAFSPDGKTLASASLDKTVRLWQLDSGKELRRYTGHENSVRSVAFSPDGKTIASASDDQTVRLWGVHSGRCLAVLVHAPEGWVAFTPDGRYKLGGNPAGSFWFLSGLCRFEPGELDPYVPSIRRLAPDEPLLGAP